ncbi:MAG TPA: CBS domain-containing protein [Acidiferrobacteraceae bacterium]|nr:CBS domain-containing protein [Acidiferrobacteraceae bacterium]
MLLEEIMTQPVVTVTMDDSLRLIREIFSKMKFHHLLVIEHDKLVGVISDRDLLKQISPSLDTSAATLQDMAVLDRPVHQIMSRNLVTLTKDASIKTAIQTFLNKEVSCIPIVDSENRVEGIVSWKDVFRSLLTFSHS